MEIQVLFIPIKHPRINYLKNMYKTTINEKHRRN